LLINDLVAIIDCTAVRGVIPTASITIRNLEETLKKALRIRAAEHGHSMEEEARQILRTALAKKALKPTNLEVSNATNLYEAIRRHIAPLGGVELNIPRRGPVRQPSSFEE
jgi:antitoxin FitA